MDPSPDVGHRRQAKEGSRSSQKSTKLNQLARSAPFSLEGEGLGMRVTGVEQSKVMKKVIYLLSMVNLNANIILYHIHHPHPQPFSLEGEGSFLATAVRLRKKSFLPFYCNFFFYFNWLKEILLS